MHRLETDPGLKAQFMQHLHRQSCERESSLPSLGLGREAKQLAQNAATKVHYLILKSMMLVLMIKLLLSYHGLALRQGNLLSMGR